MTTWQTIDDQDLSQVTYVGSWVRGGPNRGYGGTVASSTTVGDSFTVAFTGTSISVYGTVDSTSGGVVTSYAVDGAAAAEATSSAVSGEAYRQLFWASPTFAGGNHSLIVKMVRVNSNLGGTIWFDYFNVTGVSLPASSSSSPSPSLSLLPSSSSSLSPSTVFYSPLPTAVQRKLSNLGPIVGGIVGGLLVLVLLLLFYYRRRRLSTNRIDYRRRRLSQDMIDPFPAHTHQASINSMVMLVGPPPTNKYAAGRNSSRFRPSTSFSPVGPFQHADSGVQNVPPISRFDLPPAYSQA